MVCRVASGDVIDVGSGVENSVKSDGVGKLVGPIVIGEIVNGVGKSLEDVVASEVIGVTYSVDVTGSRVSESGVGKSELSVEIKIGPIVKGVGNPEGVVASEVRYSTGDVPSDSKVVMDVVVSLLSVVDSDDVVS